MLADFSSAFYFFIVHFFSIIKMRRRQSNFQLIVITHDEEFVQLLGRSEFADYYWRVSRDDNQCSIIERQSIVTNPWN